MRGNFGPSTAERVLAATAAKEMARFVATSYVAGLVTLNLENHSGDQNSGRSRPDSALTPLGARSGVSATNGKRYKLAQALPPMHQR
jgi:hypothetical protein